MIEQKLATTTLTSGGLNFAWLNPTPGWNRIGSTMFAMTQISNFTVECLSQGFTPPSALFERRVRLVNDLGEASDVIILDRDVFPTKVSGLPRFREWVMARGNFLWTGSLAHVQQLREHLFDDATWKDVPYA
jgi:hypothetical protein